jgi:hypothetical protein
MPSGSVTAAGSSRVAMPMGPHRVENGTAQHVTPSLVAVQASICGECDMTDTKYENRQNFEIFCWPELMQTFQGLVELVMVSPGTLSR